MTTDTDATPLLDATWPAAALHRAGPWLVREGQGGGKRVSAASAVEPGAEAAIDQAEAAQLALGQPVLVMVRPGEEALDAALEARGYRVVDPVVIYSAPVAALAGEAIPAIRVFPLWPPMAIQRDLWAGGHTGPERLAVMARVTGPKTALLGRVSDRAAAVAFVAVDGRQAMLHALHVIDSQRRKGMARLMLRGAAHWAAEAGAETLALAVTRDNAPACALYEAAGMDIVGGYHYRLA